MAILDETSNRESAAAVRLAMMAFDVRERPEAVVLHFVQDVPVIKRLWQRDLVASAGQAAAPSRLSSDHIRANRRLQRVFA